MKFTTTLAAYFCFGGVDQSPLASQASKPCKAWGGGLNDSMAAFGFTVAGEFSNGFNDCGLFLNGVSVFSASCCKGGC